MSKLMPHQIFLSLGTIKILFEDQSHLWKNTFIFMSRWSKYFWLAIAHMPYIFLIYVNMDPLN